jgi:hypothetical protein
MDDMVKGLAERSQEARASQSSNQVSSSRNAITLARNISGAVVMAA